MSDSKGAPGLWASGVVDYLVVLDFEATCDKGSFKPQEVIEFPMVVLNGTTGEPLPDKVFHQYVRPLIRPKLTEFCTALTGIQQPTVDAAEPFVSVWKNAVAFIDGLCAGGKKIMFVTCGDWDLKTMLPAQLAVSGLGKAGGVWRTWINLKRPFMQFCKQPKTEGMAGMLRHLNLTLEGRHHSGIDDCRNIAKIIKHLIQAGANIS